MVTKARLLALGLLALTAVGAFVLSTAWGVETEAPFWKVSAKRVESGTRKATVKNSSEEVILHSTIASKEVEVKCKSALLSEAALEGSLAKHAGKALGILELKECKLFAKEGETFKEQAGCEVAVFKSNKLAGKLWLEGTKAAGGTSSVLVFEPKELTEGKSILGTLAVTTKTTCSFTGEFKLEGDFAARLLPNNEEFTYIQLTLPATPITTVWDPASEEGELTVGMKLRASTATLQGELKFELESVEKFGGGTAPLAGIEAPFWAVNGNRLEAGKEKEIESNAAKGTPTWKMSFKGKEIEIRCIKVVVKEGKLLGSLNQHDGKFDTKTIEFTECKVFIIEGGKGVEQPKCEVPAIKTSELTARLWLEGSKSERKERAIMVFEPVSGTKVAEPVIRNKGAESCPLTEGKEEKLSITGNVAANISPENTEAPELSLTFPSKPPTSAWQSAEQESEIKVGLVFEEKVVELLIEGLPIVLKSKESFGGGPRAGACH